MENVKEKDNVSLMKSAFWFLINNVLNIAFPFATGIYVARVLLPETIGMVASAQNIVQYFVILAFLGIPTYGLREISKARNNRDELNKVYSELFIINLISTIVFSSIYLFLILIVPSYKANIYLYLICGGLIILNALNNTWFFERLEKFKFISIRNLLFKVLMFGILIQVVKTILKELGKPETLINYVTDRPGHDLRYAMDPTKIETELGWKPEHNFDTGIIATIKWNLENQEWLRHVESGEYMNWLEKNYNKR